MAKIQQSIAVLIFSLSLISSCESSSVKNVPVEIKYDDSLVQNTEHSYILELDTMDLHLYKKPLGDDKCVLKFENIDGMILLIDTVNSGVSMSTEVLDLEKDGALEVKVSFSTNWSWSTYYSIIDDQVRCLEIDHHIHQLSYLGDYYYDFFAEECNGDNVKTSLLSKKRNDFVTIATLSYIHCDGVEELWLIHEDSTKLNLGDYQRGHEDKFWKHFIQENILK